MNTTLYRISLYRQEDGTGYGTPLAYTIDYRHALIIQKALELSMPDKTFNTTHPLRPAQYHYTIEISSMPVKPWFLDYFGISEWDVRTWFPDLFKVKTSKRRKKVIG